MVDWIILIQFSSAGGGSRAFDRGSGYNDRLARISRTSLWCMNECRSVYVSDVAAAAAAEANTKHIKNGIYKTLVSKSSNDFSLVNNKIKSGFIKSIFTCRTVIDRRWRRAVGAM